MGNYVLSFHQMFIAYLHEGLAHRTTKEVIWVGTLRQLSEGRRSDGINRKIIVFQLGQRYLAMPGKCPSSEYNCSNSRRFRAISRDPDVFPDPDIFKPDRWLDAEGQVKNDHLKHIVFGFGRR